MKLDELLNSTLLEGKRLEVYEELLPLLLQEEGDGGGGGEGGGGDTGAGGDLGGGSAGDIPISTGADDVNPTPNPSGWFGRGPFVGVSAGGGGRWFRELYNSIKQLGVSNKIINRMKEIGIKPRGMERVQMAAKQAAKNVNDLMSNPRATAYKIPVWTFDKPKAPKLKRWNEGFAYEFKKELARLNEQQIVD